MCAKLTLCNKELLFVEFAFASLSNHFLRGVLSFSPNFDSRCFALPDDLALGLLLSCHSWFGFNRGFSHCLPLVLLFRLLLLQLPPWDRLWQVLERLGRRKSWRRGRGWGEGRGRDRSFFRWLERCNRLALEFGFFCSAGLLPMLLARDSWLSTDTRLALLGPLFLMNRSSFIEVKFVVLRAR